jgi:NADPH:quinone reductase-like Zn-dependent oxidoreductase
MKAVGITAYDGPQGARVGDYPKPSAGAGEVLVRVHACGVNPLDWKVCDGSVAAFLPVSPPFIIGADVAGVVEATGPGVTRFGVGDEVFGQVGLLGAYAEYAVTDETRLSRKPANLSFAEAACIPVSGATAWDLLFKDGKLTAGERVFVQAGAGGVGHYVIQLAKDAGAYVIATCSAGSADFVRSLGADEVVDYKAGRFEDSVKDIDLAVDTVGDAILTRTWAVLKPAGRMTTSVPPTVPLEHGDRTAIFSVGKPDEDGANLDRLGRLAAEGRAKPRLQRVFRFADVVDALELSKAGHVHGKLALQLID